jgi:hypothetical protein
VPKPPMPPWREGDVMVIPLRERIVLEE